MSLRFNGLATDMGMSKKWQGRKVHNQDFHIWYIAWLLLIWPSARKILQFYSGKDLAVRLIAGVFSN